MIIEADVKCYYCGHISGQIMGESSQPSGPKAFQPTSASKPVSLKSGDRLRCHRCGGPVFLDDISVLRDKKRAAKLTRELKLAGASR